MPQSPTTNWSFHPLSRQRSGQFQHHVLNSVPETAVLTTPPPLRKPLSLHIAGVAAASAAAAISDKTNGDT